MLKMSILLLDRMQRREYIQSMHRSHSKLFKVPYLTVLCFLLVISHKRKQYGGSQVKAEHRVGYCGKNCHLQTNVMVPLACPLKKKVRKKGCRDSVVARRYYLWVCHNIIT